MRLAFCAAAAMMIAATVAHSENYHLVGQKPYGTMFVDAATVKQTEGGRQAWSTFFLAKDGDGSTATVGVAFIMTLEEYDCAGSRTRHLYLQTYNSRGDPVGQTPDPQPWQIVVPGSNADVESRLVCNEEFRSLDPGIKTTPLDMLRAVRTATRSR